MGERKVKRPPGRPKGSGAKRPEQIWRGWMLRFPPELRERFLAIVPAGERAAFVRQAVARALDEREGASRMEEQNERPLH
jgi:hypothetical protein